MFFIGCFASCIIGETMHLDDITYRYNVRERDNRVAVIICERPDISQFYISYEVLEKIDWTYVPGSATTAQSKAKALTQAETYYRNAAKACPKIIDSFIQDKPTLTKLFNGCKRISIFEQV